EEVICEAPTKQMAPSQRRGYASLYQNGSCQKSEAQPLWVTLSLLLIAETRGRQATGITTTFLITMSFIWMNSAARLTGSSSASAALKSLPYSSLCQRVMLRPCHLFSFDAISQGVNCSMKSWGSGTVSVTVYIWRSVAKCGYVSRLAGSDEKYTDAVTDLISIS